MSAPTAPTSTSLPHHHHHPNPPIRFATLLHLIHALATHENASSHCQTTDPTLRAILSFPIPRSYSSDSLTPGHARALLLLLLLLPLQYQQQRRQLLRLHNILHIPLERGSGVYLEDLFVVPEYRNRGVYGTRLLRALAREARWGGAARLVLRGV